MCSGAVVVLLVRAQQTTQMLLAEDDHMIDALASDRADQTLRMSVLPWDRGVVGLSRMPIARMRRVNALPRIDTLWQWVRLCRARLSVAPRPGLTNCRKR